MSMYATLVAVRIVSSVAGGTPDDTAKHARKDEEVTLHAVVEVKEGKKSVFYSDAGEVRIGGKKVATVKLADGPALDLTWYKVEPTVENMSNTASGKFRFEEIEYAETKIGTGASLEADVRPTLIPDRGNGLGTMRFKVEARLDGKLAASPGREARRGRGAGGLSDAVHRVSIRRDDTYVGWLTELYGQPYIWASAGTTAKAHQSERLEGSDCADFVTYGWRRLGHDIPYTWSEGLRKYTKKLASGTANDEGVYVDAKGEPLPFPAVGDLVLFPRHVGVLVEDRGVAGVLDTADIMAHTLFESPHEEPIADSGYAQTKVDVMRWKK